MNVAARPACSIGRLSRVSLLRWGLLLVMGQLALGLPASVSNTVDRSHAAWAQDADADPATDESGPNAGADEAIRRAEAALADEAPEEAPAQQAPAAPKKPATNLWQLFLAGGFLMWPILGMSLVVLIFAIERLLGLRTRRVLPPELIDGLGQLSRRKGGLDPRMAYRLCQQYPSTLANVIKSMLLKVGRPHSEVESAVSHADEREANRLYRNVRPINLAVTVSPLLGLLGTVQGIIFAFMQMASGDVATNKAEQLAEGVYVALITTFAGLVVAIPAAMISHFLEGRIQLFFQRIDELIQGLLPQLERFEGTLRMSKDEAEPHMNGDASTLPATTAPAAQAAGATAASGASGTRPSASR